ncbi:hypothetical protein N5I84_05610 [Ralstonia sp. CHL-2022]|nr:hypothetical protein [Ralstonia mojiangensis]
MALPHSFIRILGRSKPSLTALIVLLVVAALLFAIPRMILPWAQSAFVQQLDPTVWADYAGPYDLAAAVVAASAIIIFLLRR